MIYTELHPYELCPIGRKLLSLGHIPVRVKRTQAGYMMIVKFKCGEVAPITYREVELLG